MVYYESTITSVTYLAHFFHKIILVKQPPGMKAELTLNHLVVGSGFPCDMQKISRDSPSFASRFMVTLRFVSVTLTGSMPAKIGCGMNILHEVIFSFQLLLTQ